MVGTDETTELWRPPTILLVYMGAVSSFHFGPTETIFNHISVVSSIGLLGMGCGTSGSAVTADTSSNPVFDNFCFLSTVPIDENKGKRGQECLGVLILRMHI